MMLLAIDFENLHTILRSLYTEMMPLCSNMAGVAKGIAGLGALFYVAVRVWQSLARTEAIDVYPLLRPFAVGFCIMFFPTFVLGTINGVLSPVVQGTNRMLETQTMDMNHVTWRINNYEIEEYLIQIPSYKRNGQIKEIIRKHLNAQGMLMAGFSVPEEEKPAKAKEQMKIKKQPRKQSNMPAVQPEEKTKEEFVQTDEERDAIMALIAMGGE